MRNAYMLSILNLLQWNQDTFGLLYLYYIFFTVSISSIFELWWEIVNHWKNCCCCDHIMDYGLAMTKKICHFNVNQWLCSASLEKTETCETSVFKRSIKQWERRRRRRTKKKHYAHTLQRTLFALFDVAIDEQRQNSF